MTDQGKLHPHTKSCDHGEFIGKEPLRRCSVNAEDRYEDKKADRYIYVTDVKIPEENRRQGNADRD
jgi:hypothetical protein